MINRSKTTEPLKSPESVRQNGEVISERTVEKYIKEMGIRAQWVKPWTITTIDSDLSNELQNILDEQFTPDRPNAVWCSDITYIWTTDGFTFIIPNVFIVIAITCHQMTLKNYMSRHRQTNCS